MEIILLEDIDKVGDKHEIVDVKPGFARNYLLPHNLAMLPTPDNLKRAFDDANVGSRESSHPCRLPQVRPAPVGDRPVRSTVGR